MRLSFCLILVVLFVISNSSLALELKSLTFEGVRYTQVAPNADGEVIRLYLNDKNGRKIATFDKLRLILKSKKERLIFATNAGMFGGDGNPLGFYVEGGVLVKSADVIESGNYAIKPTGILYISNNILKLGVGEQFKEGLSGAYYAIQSGPMLVEDGVINKKLSYQSNSKYIRSAACEGVNGGVSFIIADNGVSLFNFSNSLILNFSCWRVLYLDGAISSFYLPLTKRFDGERLGPIVGMSVSE